MHLNALLDVEVVAVETEDELSVLLELQAPQSEAETQRPAHTLQVVLDRSGSMNGGRLEAAKRSLRELVARFDAKDRFGLVTFDNNVYVDVPCRPLTDRDGVLRAIDRIHLGGSTNLSSELLRGIEEARDAKGDGGATILLLSDGRANNGTVDPDALRGLAAGARRDGMTLSTVGFGLATTRSAWRRSLRAALATRTSPRRPTPPRRSWRPRSTACSTRSSRPRP